MSDTQSNGVRAHKRASFGTLGRRAKAKLKNDNDIKIIIQGANSQTGIGKTTLAIELCRFIDQNEWNAEEKSFVDVQEYLNSYLEYPKGSALLLDEIGAGADSRRSMSKENVNLSQGWQLLRSRNVATVATLPSTNMLDSRLLELADYWILVKSRGLAQPYEINVNDFSGAISRDSLPGDEHIKFPDLPAGDADKKHLDRIKDDMVKGDGLKSIPLAEHKEKLDKAKDSATMEYRNDLITQLYNNTELTYEAIGNLPAIDLQRPSVYSIVKKQNENGDN